VLSTAEISGAKMKRVLSFVSTNVAVLAVIYTVLRVLGIDDVMARSGNELDLGALLVFSAVVGFSGAFISLLMSKWIAKFSTGARVIDTPSNATESWLKSTVYRLADAAKIGRPQVAIYDSPDINAFATGPSRNNALVAVSAGLLQRLGEPEVEAVLGHPQALQAFGIAGGRVTGLKRLFMSHPPLQERIAALQRGG
jgi:heat shock protein HtpX